jgi:branched-chain amino acid transport system permease protein
MDLLIQVVTAGLIYGSMYALLGAGITLQAGVMKIINVAFCHVMVLAMYVVVELARHGVSPIVAFPFVVTGMGVFGSILYLVFLHNARAKEGLNLVIITLGLAWVFESVLQQIYGVTPVTVPPGGVLSETVVFGPNRLSIGQIAAFGVSLLGVAGIAVVLRKTYFGRAIRAASQEEYAAQIVGVHTVRVRIIAFFISSAAAGAVGAVLISFYLATPSVGYAFLLPAFVAVVIGGLGSVKGAVVGGLSVGLIQGISAGYTSASWSDAALYGAMFLVLVVRPQGLFGEVRV